MPLDREFFAASNDISIASETFLFSELLTKIAYRQILDAHTFSHKKVSILIENIFWLEMFASFM